MLIVVGSNIMPDNIVANQGEQPEPDIWLDPGSYSSKVNYWPVQKDETFVEAMSTKTIPGFCCNLVV
jgi:hypothetical protein